jgi:hypothetical protein
MAIPTHVGTGAFQDGSAATATAAIPAGTAAGHIAIVTIYKENTAAVTAPSGFTLVTNTPISTSTPTHHSVYWKRLTAADTGTYSFSWTGAVWRESSCSIFSGCATTGTPTEIHNANFTNSAVTATPAVSGTTTGTDRLLVWSATNFQFGTWTVPTSFVDRSAGGAFGMVTATLGQAAAGPTGSLSGSCSTAAATTAFLFALLPDVGGGSPAPTTPSLSVIDRPLKRRFLR